jgi:putative oxidoreductase
MLYLYLFLLGRILLGGYFMISGYRHFKHLANNTAYAASKGVPMPKESVIVTGLMMFLGGLGILIGAYIEWAVLLLVLFLLGTLVKMHRYWEVTEPMARMGEHINFYKNLALLGALLMLLAIPTPWAWSLVF